MIDQGLRAIVIQQVLGQLDPRAAKFIGQLTAGAPLPVVFRCVIRQRSFKCREIDRVAESEVRLRGLVNRSVMLEAQADDAEQMIGEGETREPMSKGLF